MNSPTGELAKVNVLGVLLTVGDYDRVVDAVRRALSAPATRPRYVCATSVHGVVEAQRDPHLRALLNGAFINHPDGLPLVWVGRRLGARDMRQITGPHLMPRICALTARMTPAPRHFFYGGKPGVAEALARTLQRRHPGLRVAGWHCPPFRPLSEQERGDTVREINASKADIIWVGLSTPKQERWIGEVCPHLQAKLLFSVGAAFDFETGQLQHAPAWVSHSGLEWFYRLLKEPRRLTGRYASIVPRYIGHSVLQMTGMKEYRADA